MEETLIVIMLKDKETGFLDKEIASFKVEENENLIYNTYAVEEDGKYQVHIKLTCDRDVEDWEFNAIYDYYDAEPILEEADSIEEEDDCYNPTWDIRFDFIDDTDKMEDKIQKILNIHKKELESVYETISDKRDEY